MFMESFEEVLKQYEPMIWSIIHRAKIYKNKEEFYQIGLIALWEAMKRYNKEIGDFTPFAYIYIRGRIFSELTKEAKHDERTAFPTEEFWYMIEDGNIDQPLELETILSYFNELTEKQKKWVVYTALGYSTKEIAEKEKVSLSAVKGWKQGAKAKFKIEKEL